VGYSLRDEITQISVTSSKLKKQMSRMQTARILCAFALWYPGLLVFLFLQQCQEALITEKEFTSPEAKEAEEMWLSCVRRGKDGSIRREMKLSNPEA